MRVIQSSLHFPLASVKPLDRLLSYRAYCLRATQDAFARGSVTRSASPATGGPLEPFGEVDGFIYLRCANTGSLFLSQVAPDWGRLLAEISAYRHSPQAFQSELAAARAEAVYQPKLDWIVNTLHMQGVRRPRVLECVTPPGEFTAFLAGSPAIADVVVATEAELIEAGRHEATGQSRVQAAVLLESLDRADDPEQLLRGVRQALSPGGLLFVTGLVASGFDMAVLGSRNRYLYPPDRTNCFTLEGLERLLARMGFDLLEMSTPGVLDVEIVLAHLAHDPSLSLSAFERALLMANDETRTAFQTFLQENRLSSFARLVGRRIG